jgi:DNA polymerase V
MNYVWQNSEMELFVSESDTRQYLSVGEANCGFPSPAHDYSDNKLDLNEYLIRHPSATFYIRAKGHSMIDAGIHDGDLLIIDRAVQPTNNIIVLAVVDGEFTIKKIQVHEGRLYLMPKNTDFRPIEITDAMDFKVWGVVTYVIHKI